MFQHFHLTRRQWFGILKWSVYVLVFLLTVVTQSAILSRLRPFGLKFSVVPILLVCICLREGPEKGGLFVLLGATFYALSGVDMGNVSLLVVTVCAVLSAFLCQTVLADRIISAAVCCFATLLINSSLIFAYKLLLGLVQPKSWLTVLLPSAALSMLFFPLTYLLVKAISRIGGDHGV